MKKKQLDHLKRVVNNMKQTWDSSCCGEFFDCDDCPLDGNLCVDISDTLIKVEVALNKATRLLKQKSKSCPHCGQELPED